jgi:hypothetical protein
MSAAERMAKHVGAHSTVPRGTCADPDRRRRLEANPAAWLKHYLPGAYPRPFDAPHHGIIDGAVEASDKGGRFAVAAARGLGKSTLLWGLVLFLKLSGRQEFPVCLPWAAGAMKRAMSFWKAALSFNETLAADYPEFCAPFVHARGVPQRLRSQVWSDTQKPCGALLQAGDGLIVMPDNQGCIGGSTINGNPRGLNHPQDDGTVLRPTLALIDDPQDRQTAKSAQLVAETIVKIDGDIGGMGAAGSELPMLVSGNCIEPGDAMAHYLTAEGWRGLRVSAVLTWPDGWDQPDSPARLAWAEWWDAHRDPQNGEKIGRAYYRRHKKVMTAGMVLSAPHSYRRSPRTPDPLYGAMRQYHVMGHDAFWAEQQQKPIDTKASSRPYELRPDMILARADPTRQPMIVPPDTRAIVAATDLNPSYALSSAVVGFGAQQVASVLWYGLYRGPGGAGLSSGDDTPAARGKAVYEGLVAVGRGLAALPCRPELWVIDASGTDFDTVLAFCPQAPTLCGIAAMAVTGRGAKNYRPYGKTVIGQPREQCHMAMDAKRRKWMAFNADYWREVSQRAWLGSLGAPGSCSLPAGTGHREFAEQCCREPLHGKADVGGQMVWIYGRQPGPHDFGDCLYMAFAGAAWQGIGTGGNEVKPKSTKANVLIYRPSNGRR